MPKVKHSLIDKSRVACFPRRPPTVQYKAMLEPNPFGVRLRQALRARDMTQRMLADQIGLSPQAVNQWVKTGEISQENLISCCNILQIRTDWLLTGEGEMERADKSARDAGVEDSVTHGDNFEPGPNVREVPLISWIQAGQWNEIQDNFRPGEAERMVLATKRVGPRSYAVRVVGDSMEPRFPDGCIIIVDPDKVPEHGSPVIVRLENTQEGTFKLLQLDGQRRYLKPINSNYGSLRPITEAAVITGVVVQMFMDV